MRLSGSVPLSPISRYGSILSPPVNDLTFTGSIFHLCQCKQLSLVVGNTSQALFIRIVMGACSR
jgi:hypothetical protein